MFACERGPAREPVRLRLGAVLAEHVHVGPKEERAAVEHEVVGATVAGASVTLIGVLFATGVTLLLVPALYLIVEDARSLRIKWFGRSAAPPAVSTPVK